MQFLYSRVCEASSSRWAGRLSFLMVLGASFLSPVFAARALDPGETPSLTRIRVQQLMDTVEVYRKGDGRWWVAGREVPARADVVLQTIRQLEALEDKNPRSIRTENDLRDNGLHVVAARFVRLTFNDGRVRWLRLGEIPEQAAVTWARDAGNPLLAETPIPGIAYRTTGIPVLADINSWTSPQVVPEVYLENIDTLRVVWHDDAGQKIRYTVARHGDAALLLEPAPARAANPHKARETFGQAVSLVIDGYLEPGESPPALHQEPRVTVRIVLRSGAVYDLKAMASDARFDYVPHPDAPHVMVKLLRNRLDAFRHTSDYIATSYPYGPELDDGISGPPPPGFAIYAPHGYHDHPEDPEDHEEGDHEGHDHPADHAHDHGLDSKGAHRKHKSH